MKYASILMVAIILLSTAGMADEQSDAKDKAAEQTEPATAAQDEEKLSGAEKERQKDEAIAALVEEYNAGVDTDLDEVVCEKRRVTGSRRKVRVCQTRREILEEEAAAERAMRMRNRSSSDPAASQGMGSN